MDDQELNSVFINTPEIDVAQREKEINEIIKSIQSLSMIFKDLQTMVIDQGTILDRIDYNVEETRGFVENAYNELQKVQKATEKIKFKSIWPDFLYI